MPNLIEIYFNMNKARKYLSAAASMIDTIILAHQQEAEALITQTMNQNAIGFFISLKHIIGFVVCHIMARREPFLLWPHVLRRPPLQNHASWHDIEKVK